MSTQRIISNSETNTWGSWLMFNDFFAPKFLIRVLIRKLQKNKSKYEYLQDLMTESIEIIRKTNFSR